VISDFVICDFRLNVPLSSPSDWLDTAAARTLGRDRDWFSFDF
jgi:hypothetical protein